MGIKNKYLQINNHVFEISDIQAVSEGSNSYAENDVQYTVTIIFHSGSPIVICLDTKKEAEFAFAKIAKALKAK